MKILYHFFKSVIDFVFPSKEEVYEVKTFPKNNTYLGQNITALFSYQDEKVKDAVWQIKYYRNKVIARDISIALYEKIISLKIAGSFMIVPIPMSDTSRKQRGYNQTEFVAEKVKLLFDPVICLEISKDLCKINTSRPQHTLERSERLQNAVGMFYVKEKNCFKDKNVLILDDVVTTGSTLREAMRIVLENGASNVHTIAIAH